MPKCILLHRCISPLGPEALDAQGIVSLIPVPHALIPSILVCPEVFNISDIMLGTTKTLGVSLVCWLAQQENKAFGR